MNLKNPRNHQSSTRKSFNLTQFNERFYKNDEACKEVFIKTKYPEGFVCDECGNTEFSWIKKRKAIQCKCCCHQVSILSDTLFQDSKLTLYQILLGIYYFVTSQSGINGSTLSIYLGVNVNTARLFLRKMREACKNDNEKQILSEMIDLDGVYLGGVEVGGKRGLGSKKQPILVAVEMKDTGRGYYAPARARFSLVQSENGKDILSFMKHSVEEGITVRADKGRGISVLGQIKKDYDGNIIIDDQGKPIKKYSYNLENTKFDKDDKILEFVHKYASNLNSLILGTYHGVKIEYVEEIVNEYTWRFNNRTNNNNMSKVYIILRNIMELDVKAQKQFKVM